MLGRFVRQRKDGDTKHLEFVLAFQSIVTDLDVDILCLVFGIYRMLASVTELRQLSDNAVMSPSHDDQRSSTRQNRSDPDET